MSDNTKMREAVLKILTSYKQEMERYGYYSSNPGVSVDDFEEIADEIVAWQAAQSAEAVPVVGDVVGWRWIRVSTGEPDGGRFFDGFPSDSAIKTAANSYIPCAPQLLIVQPTTSISAAELDALRKGERDREVGAAVQRAAKELPEGCDISIRIESGSASVELYLPDTDASFDMDVDADNRLAAEIHAAIDAAIAGEK